jgi:hypothetical protein
LEAHPNARPLPAGLTPIQLAELLNDWIADSIAYTRRKRAGFRSASSVLKLGIRRLQDDLAMSIASTSDDRLTQATIDAFYREYRDIWVTTSQRWLEYRRQSERG